MGLSKEEHADLWSQVDSEGFEYYMLQYGPDLDAIEKLGFDRKEVELAINLFERIEVAISEGERFAEEID